MSVFVKFCLFLILCEPLSAQPNTYCDDAQRVDDLLWREGILYPYLSSKDLCRAKELSLRIKNLVVPALRHRLLNIQERQNFFSDIVKSATSSVASKNRVQNKHIYAATYLFLKALSNQPVSSSKVDQLRAPSRHFFVHLSEVRPFQMRNHGGRGLQDVDCYLSFLSHLSGGKRLLDPFLVKAPPVRRAISSIHNLYDQHVLLGAYDLWAYFLNEVVQSSVFDVATVMTAEEIQAFERELNLLPYLKVFFDLRDHL